MTILKEKQILGVISYVLLKKKHNSICDCFIGYAVKKW